MTQVLSRRGLALIAAAAGMAGTARADGPESTFDRVRRTKVLRIAVFPGSAPYFIKDLATGEWGGACITLN